MKKAQAKYNIIGNAGFGVNPLLVKATIAQRDSLGTPTDKLVYVQETNAIYAWDHVANLWKPANVDVGAFQINTLENAIQEIRVINPDYVEDEAERLALTPPITNLVYQKDNNTAYRYNAIGADWTPLGVILKPTIVSVEDETTTIGQHFIIFPNSVIDNVTGGLMSNAQAVLLETLGDTLYEIEIFENIASGTAGTITPPLESTIVLDRYENAGDCLIVKTDSANRPIDEPARTAAGAIITATLDTSGNYVLSGTPAGYPVSLVYQIEIEGKHRSNVDNYFVLNQSEIYSTDKISNDSDVEGDTLTDALDSLENDRTITKEPTGFVEPESVVVSYDGTARTITLTGTVNAYYRGVKVPALVSGWESDPHNIADGEYFLLYNDGGFQWTTTPWNFSDLMIAFVFRDGANFCIRECHGLMAHQTHKEFHEVTGTYLKSGGDLSAFVLNSTTASERRPDIAETLIYDEDLPTVNAALTSKAYSWLYLSGANDANVSTDNTEIISVTTDQPNYNLFTGGNWTQEPFPVNAYGKIFVMAIPATADAACQKSRFVFIQPQFVSTNLSAVQARTPNNVTLGHIAAALPEYVFISEIIIRYTAGNWRLIEVNKLTGTRTTQISSPTGSFLSTVARDNSLVGNGTPANPLGLSGTFTPASDSTTAFQFFKADGTTSILTIDSINRTVKAEKQLTDENYFEMVSSYEATALTDRVKFYFKPIVGETVSGLPDVGNAGLLFSYVSLDSNVASLGYFTAELGQFKFKSATNGDAFIITNSSNSTVFNVNTDLFTTTANGLFINTANTKLTYDVNSGSDISNFLGLKTTASSGGANLVNGVATFSSDVNAGLAFYTRNSSNKDIIYADVVGTPKDTTAGDEDGDLIFRTMSGGTLRTEKMRITSDGKLLIGKTTTIDRRFLDIQSNTDGQDAFIRMENIATTTSSGAGIELRSGAIDFYMIARHGVGGLITMADNYPIVFSTNGTERARISNDGYFGIGITSPTSLAHIQAPSSQTTPLLIVDGAGRSVTDSVVAKFQRTLADNSTFVDIDSNNRVAALRLLNNNSVKWYAYNDYSDDSFRVGVTTSVPQLIIFPENGISMRGRSLTASASLYSNSTGTNGSAIELFSSDHPTQPGRIFITSNYSNADSGSGAIFIRGYSGSAAVDWIKIDKAGKVQAPPTYSVTVGATNRDLYIDNTGLIGYVSSIRVSKKDIVYNPDTSFIYDLKPVEFNYRKKDESGNYTNESDGDRQYGLIAEDVNEIKPELCYKEGEELKGVNYSRLVPILLNEIQRLKKEIDIIKGEHA